MKCRVCEGPQVIELRQHNAAFCAEHFIAFCRRQVQKTIDKFKMFEADDRVLVAVSGGKDSLALWDILVELGYDADGLVIGLGIGEYSENSSEFARAFAAERGLKLHEYDLQTEHGFTVPAAAAATKRVPCSSCGLSKRHIFDDVAVRHDYDVVVTGHNLDDEAAVLFGNVARWQAEYLGRQHPVLPAVNGFPRKTKPLIRLTEREMAAYCILRNIDYVVEECPMAAGNKHLHYKDLLNQMEVASPGSKQAFYFGFLERGAERFARPLDSSIDDEVDGMRPAGVPAVSPCLVCGSPSSNEVCAFCRLVDLAAPNSVITDETVSVEITARADKLAQ
ncbi:MAG: hypothetical protein ACI81L_000077 [Verrucomicrobiales bacterium]|jgi:uncharacterized protein (TIGR00269 family)